MVPRLPGLSQHDHVPHVYKKERAGALLVAVNERGVHAWITKSDSMEFMGELQPAPPLGAREPASGPGARGLIPHAWRRGWCPGEAGSLGLADEVLDAKGGAHGVRDRLGVALARPVLHEREDGGRT